MNTHRHFSIRALGATDVGQRKNNEDAFLINEDLGLFIVADGMGGHDKGEVASWFTSENLEKIIAAHSTSDGNATLDPLPASGEEMDFDDLLTYAVISINRRLFEQNEAESTGLFASKKDDDGIGALLRKKSRMGTTLISLLIRENRVYITHVGDSRAYRICAGSIQRLTHDHSWVEEKIRSGEITPEEAKTHKKRNVITRSVGFKPEVEADIDVLTVYPPERYLLCSDGLSNVVSEDELLSLASIENMQEACGELIDLAKLNGGKDNITCVLIDFASPAIADSDGHSELKEFTDL